MLASVLLEEAWQWQCPPFSLPIFCFDNPETDVITASACLHFGPLWIYHGSPSSLYWAWVTEFDQQSGSSHMDMLVPKARVKPHLCKAPRLSVMRVSRRPGDDWSKADWDEAGQPLRGRAWPSGQPHWAAWAADTALRTQIRNRHGAWQRGRRERGATTLRAY